MVYVTSTPIDPAVIEYYLALLPGVIPSHARARLTLVSADDASARPLSEKLLSRPRLLAQDRAPTSRIGMYCHLIPYNTTALEEDVALTLGIPMYGADPKFAGPRKQVGLPTSVRRGGRRAIRSAPRTSTASARSSEAIVAMLAGRTDMAR